MSDGVFASIGGHIYRWNGWGGCQLESSEWRRVHAGTERVLDFGVGQPPITIRVWRTERKWPYIKVRNLWAVSPTGTLDEHNARIRGLKDALRGLW